MFAGKKYYSYGNPTFADQFFVCFRLFRIRKYEFKLVLMFISNTVDGHCQTVRDGYFDMYVN